jgi:hypothetical protein
MKEIATLLCIMVPACAAFAAERPILHNENAAAADSTIALPAVVADLDFDAIPTLPLLAPTRKASAGVAASLPETPDAQIPGTQLPFYLFQRGETTPTTVVPEAADRVTFEEPTFDEPSMASLIDASPIAGAARRIGSQNFNTEDGVLDDFAICYRINRRASVQVIPGDPAPVKIPVATLQNNMGVTVGMVVRLSRKR